MVANLRHVRAQFRTADNDFTFIMEGRYLLTLLYFLFLKIMAEVRLAAYFGP